MQNYVPVLKCNVLLFLPNGRFLGRISTRATGCIFFIKPTVPHNNTLCDALKIQIFTSRTFSSSFCPDPVPAVAGQCLTDIDRMAPIHPQLRYPPQRLLLNCMLFPSNCPKKADLLRRSFTEKVYERYSVILETISSLCNILSILRGIFFY